MKKIKIINILKTIKIIVLLNLLGIIAGAMIVVFHDIDFQRNVIISNDISLYETKKYYYLPNYEEFEYKENITGFYTFDSSYTLSARGVSYVLELQFTDKKSYNEFLEYEYKRYEYDDNPTVLKNDYACYLCAEISQYYSYGNGMPYATGLLCLNEKNMKIRYISYRNIEFSIDKEFNDVFENTNCDW